VAEYRLDSIASLARQMEFMPAQTLRAQVTSAEGLLHDIDPAKAYPLELVIFRITGYRPKEPATDLLTGLALQHDLGLLIEQASDTLDLSVQAFKEPILCIDEVTERFNVTSKTIQRWRRRGLPARRFTFADGKRRVGFLLSSVERFFAKHRDQIPQGINLSHVDDTEHRRIIVRARELARGGCWEAEIARRIARRLNRSPSLVLHLLRQHEAQHPEDSVLRWAPIASPTEQSARILRAYRRGVTIATLAQRYHYSRATIYRIIMDERIARLSRRKVRFIDDPLYHQPDAADAIDAIVSQEELGAGASGEELRVPRDLPAYLQELYRTPLLSVARERALFLKFNFHKFLFVQARRRLEPQFARSRDLDALEQHRRDAIDTKNTIVRANLRLVVSVARKHLRPGLNLMELVSDGNMTLMRAVESFDFHKGNRFSTYATLALMKGFARSVPTMMYGVQRLGGGDAALPEVADHRRHRDLERMLHRDELRQLFSRLDEREQRVLAAHYGLDGDHTPETFDQVAQRMGLSKQRVRQIEQTAMTKLRAGR
jgi:RNA polymerase sigma factor (sigma-70 family)